MKWITNEEICHEPPRVLLSNITASTEIVRKIYLTIKSRKPIWKHVLRILERGFKEHMSIYISFDEYFVVP